MSLKRKCSDHDLLGKNSKNLPVSHLRIKGRLSCNTHILHTNPECMLLELCTVDCVVFIIITNAQQFSWIEDLKIGMYYEVSNLKSVSITLQGVKDCSRNCYQTTTESVCSSIHNSGGAVTLPAIKDFVSMLHGEVTEVDSELGLYQLDYAYTLITSTLSCIARVPTLKQGESVVVHNVHKTTSETGEVYLVMCSRSFIAIIGAKQIPRVSADPYSSLSPILKCMKCNHHSFKDILWLQHCRKFLKENFSDEFLHEIDINPGDEDVYRSSLLLNITRLLYAKQIHRKHEILVEVMSEEHSCGSIDQDAISYSFISLDKLFSMCTPLEAVDLEIDNPTFWQYKIQDGVDNLLLLGYLYVKNSSHSLALKDANGSIVCVFRESRSKAKDLMSFNGKLVLVWKHKLLMEKFTWNEKVPKTVNLNYIFISSDQIYNLSSMEGLRSSCSSNDTKKKCSATCPLVYNFNSLRVEMTSHVVFPPKETLKEYWSQLVLIQHTPAMWIPGFSKAPCGLILVSLLGSAVSWSDSNKVSDNEVSDSVFISLKGSLLTAHYFIAVNHIYEIRIPFSFGSDFFEHRVSLSHIQSIANSLPTTKAVVLPNGSEIHYVDSPYIPFFKLNFGDCYSIADAVDTHLDSDFLSLTAFVVSRTHDPPRFERERESSGAFGFGVPDCKIITLHMSDQPPDSPNLYPATVFLSFWTHLKYPLAVIPGSKVNLRFVRRVVPKVVSPTTPIYFRASVLTSIEIVELPSSMGTNLQDSLRCTQSDQLGGRNLIRQLKSNKAGWISLSMMTLYSMSITTVCKSCGHSFINGSCSFVGCHANGEPSLLSQVTIRVDEFGTGTVFIVVPNKHVRALLKISDEIWNALIVVAKKVGMLQYHHHKSAQAGNRTVEERAFKMFCQTALHGRRTHMLCRRFITKNPVLVARWTKKITTLYCEEFKDVLLSRSVRPFASKAGLFN